MNIIPLVGGTILSVTGSYIFYDYRRFNKQASRTQGRILSYEEYLSRNSDNVRRKMYRPRFEIKVLGKTYVVESNASFRSKIIPVGHYAEVLYQAGDEANARLAKGNGHGLGILLIGLSLPAFYFGLYH